MNLTSQLTTNKRKRYFYIKTNQMIQKCRYTTIREIVSVKILDSYARLNNVLGWKISFINFDLEVLAEFTPNWQTTKTYVPIGSVAGRYGVLVE